MDDQASQYGSQLNVEYRVSSGRKEAGRSGFVQSNTLLTDYNTYIHTYIIIIVCNDRFHLVYFAMQSFAKTLRALGL